MSVDTNSCVVFPRVFHLKIIIQQVTIVVNQVIRFYTVCFIENSVLRDVTNASSQQTAATKQEQQTGLRSQLGRISNSSFLAVEDKKDKEKNFLFYYV